MPAQRPITGTRIDNGQPYTAYAWGDGANDDRATLQTALDTCGVINVPSGKYKITGTLTVPNRAGAGIKGIGGGYSSGNNAGTVIQASFTNGTAISNLSSSPVFQHFTITRVGTPTSGSYGLDLGSANATGAVKDVWAIGHYTGFYLRATGTSTARTLVAQQSVSDGFIISGKWNITNAYGSANGGHGIVATGSYDSGAMSGLASFANAGSGFYADMPNLRLSNSFFGGDGGNAVYIVNNNAAGKYNQLIAVATEQEPAFGFYLGVNTRDNRLTNCYYTTPPGVPSANGLYAEGALLSVAVGHFGGNSSAGSGMVLTNGNVTIKAGVAKDTPIGLAATAGTDSLQMYGCYFSACPTPLDVAVPYTAYGNY